MWVWKRQTFRVCWFAFNFRLRNAPQSVKDKYKETKDPDLYQAILNVKKGNYDDVTALLTLQFERTSGTFLQKAAPLSPLGGPSES